LFYSLRVLSPAFALLAVTCSYGLGLLNRYRPANGVIAFALIMLSIEALPKTLVLPENPYHCSIGEWIQSGDKFSREVRIAEPKLVRRIKFLPMGKRRAIITDIAGLPRVLAPFGVEAIPLWSPEIAWLFEPTIPSDELAKRWRNSGLVYVALGAGSPTADFVQQRVRWKSPFFTVIPIVQNEGLLIQQVVANVLPTN